MKNDLEIFKTVTLKLRNKFINYLLPIVNEKISMLTTSSLLQHHISLMKIEKY